MKAAYSVPLHYLMKKRLEQRLDVIFAARLARCEAMAYKKARPSFVTYPWHSGVSGTLFRALLLSEFGKDGPLSFIYTEPHRLQGVIGDPFMGGGTVLAEANRLGFHVVGCDGDPMACWFSRQALVPLDLQAFAADTEMVIENTAAKISRFYQTRCIHCRAICPVLYFLWVKRVICPHCGVRNDLWPRCRVAYAGAHPCHVLVCHRCGALNEFGSIPADTAPHKAACKACASPVRNAGNVVRSRAECCACQKSFPLPAFHSVPKHRMFAIAYHCMDCADTPSRRLFKVPSAEDVACAEEAERLISGQREPLPLPSGPLVRNAQTDDLFQWGFRNTSDLYSPRQAYGLGVLLAQILAVPTKETRYALLTVFARTVLYQNRLCGYDVRRLKCESAFLKSELRGGLVFCENNVLGKSAATHGGFQQLIKKYRRTKTYALAPFEFPPAPKGKPGPVFVKGESIGGILVKRWPDSKTQRQALLLHGRADHPLPHGAVLDGIATEVPRFRLKTPSDPLGGAWLREALRDSFAPFRKAEPLPQKAGVWNDEMDGYLELNEFTQMLSATFGNVVRSLRPSAPFAFTYAHEDALGYVPVVVAMLDAGLSCTRVCPVLKRMHVKVSVDRAYEPGVEALFVGRQRMLGGDMGSEHADEGELRGSRLSEACAREIEQFMAQMREVGVSVADVDRQSFIFACIARWAVLSLEVGWEDMRLLPLAERVEKAKKRMDQGVEWVVKE